MDCRNGAARGVSGFVKLYRGWQDNPALTTAERKVAWIWLIENAAWKDTVHNVMGRTAPILRGQICVSRAQLASAWNWSGSAVERFLTRLETEQMIGRETGQGKSIITICNYGKYQDKDDKTGQATGQEAGQEADKDRTTKERREEGKKEKNNNDYAFSGKIVRLSQADFNRWQKSYSGVDLMALLQTRDDWLRDQPAKDQKNWFQSTSNWLANKNQAAAVQSRQASTPSMPVC